MPPNAALKGRRRAKRGCLALQFMPLLRHFPPHRITSSARSRMDPGIVSPSALAVFRFTASLNLHTFANNDHIDGTRVSSSASCGSSLTLPRALRCSILMFYIAQLLHLITFVACRRICSGTLIRSAFAVFKFTTTSNAVGCSYGKSEGLAPRNILSIK